VKSALRASTDRAIADGVFGVPTMIVDVDGKGSKHFFGADSLPMLEEYLLRAGEDGGFFSPGADWDRAALVKTGVSLAQRTQRTKL
jgi:hypothetical protein